MCFQLLTCQLTGLFNGWVSISAFGAICLAMWYGGKLVFEKELSVGILTSFLVYTVSIAGGLAIISTLYGEFMQVSQYALRKLNIRFFLSLFWTFLQCIS